MQKSEVRDADSLIIEENTRKAKANKHGTVCKDKRRNRYHCGMCGSEDIATQGVVSCSQCQKETLFLIPATQCITCYGDRIFDNVPPEYRPCNCLEEVEGFGKPTYRRPYYIRYVHKCMVCGSVGINIKYCHICAQSKKRFLSGVFWIDKFGNKFCQNCGYRSTVKS